MFYRMHGAVHHTPGREPRADRLPVYPPLPRNSRAAPAAASAGTPRGDRRPRRGDAPDRGRHPGRRRGGRGHDADDGACALPGGDRARGGRARLPTRLPAAVPGPAGRRRPGGGGGAGHGLRGPGRARVPARRRARAPARPAGCRPSGPGAADRRGGRQVPGLGRRPRRPGTGARHGPDRCGRFPRAPLH